MYYLFLTLYIKNLMQGMSIVSICTTYLGRCSVISAPPSVHLHYFTYYISIRIFRLVDDHFPLRMIIWRKHPSYIAITNPSKKPILQPEFAQKVCIWPIGGAKHIWSQNQSILQKLLKLLLLLKTAGNESETAA